MTEKKYDWNPYSEHIRNNQILAYDTMRRECPVAYSERFGWTLFRHADVCDALNDPATFSNKVSRFLSVPNGMDGDEHGVYRKIIEPYFSEQQMNIFEPLCRNITRKILQPLEKRTILEFTSEITLPFAVAVQCAFLGWPESLYKILADWIARNQEATLVQDRTALSYIAKEFSDIIHELLNTRKHLQVDAEYDLTASLMHEKVYGRNFHTDEVTSILRNWTAGEIGTISAAAGIVVEFLANDLELQEKLRDNRALLPYAIDEILRIHGPLVHSRRVTTKEIKIRDKTIPAGQRISLNWISANRDETVFENATAFRFDRNPTDNLLYGAGIHVCPGAPLARLELRIFIEELFDQTNGWKIPENQSPAYAFYPAGGFSRLPLETR